MRQEPTIVERPEQPYVAIRGAVTMAAISQLADRLPEVFAWLAERGVEPVDAPFFKYDVIDMERELVMQAGVPVAEVQQGEGEVVAGVLPGGRYASVTHVGHPEGLLDATRDLLAWADERELKWDVDGDRWGCRLEVYKSDPREEPDLSKWETELLFRLRE
ncbi:MAG TPA: GyrI-like domain-containing protein [Kribbella sp.]|nr:GyrI-like domain-containing protein [Kribbella sp.]